MKLSISNLAWPVEETDWCLDQLVKHNIKGVELAPLKVFDSWDSVNEESIKAVRNKYERVGLKISSFQAITYAVNDLALLGDRVKVDNFLQHMDKVAFLLSELGGENAVFGSPGLRVNNEYNTQELSELFIRIDRVFSKYKVNFVLETVPNYYGCKLLNRIEQTEAFLSSLKLSNVSRHFDSGCQYLSNDLEDIIRCNDFISKSKHLHISEVDLNNFVNPSQYNSNITAQVKEYYEGNWCVLEINDKNYSRECFLQSMSNFIKLFSYKQ
ncbi:sugar phosphate isomerase/epimerase family protein [Psychromonas sp. L1A2]|uniref:sugar phosphate isomerase/epimerase family protein n=1 Tax=Psychromonas sp. L1A2 TaxID=2686356 RepID=UPI00135CE535|nr:sugar phosphate isomerase/epimerase [Psychromonas sp. L1A2]